MVDLVMLICDVAMRGCVGLEIDVVEAQQLR